MVRSARRGDARVIAGLLGELGYPASDQAVLGREAAASAQEALAILDRLGTLEEPDRLRHELAAEPF